MKESPEYGHKEIIMDSTEGKAQVSVSPFAQEDGAVSPKNYRQRFMVFYRSTLFQILVLCALAFTGPDIDDAVQGVGGGGNVTPWVNSVANSTLYAAVFCVSLLGGPFAGGMGIRALIILGAATWPINGSSYYVNVKYSLSWYFILARTIHGFGYGLWYVAEAAIILSYPEEERRGFYLAVWVMSRNVGQIVGGAINLANNVKNSSVGAISLSTYAIFLVIESLGFPIAWLISPSHKVRRPNGEPVKLNPRLHWKDELKLLGQAVILKRNLLLSIYFFYSFFYGGVLSTYLSLHFTVRARTLSSLIVPAAVIIIVFVFGRFLDMTTLNQRQKAQSGLFVVMVPTIASFIWLIINESIYRKKDTTPVFDWSSPGWANAYLPYFIMQNTGYMCQTYIYWLISCWSFDVVSNARQGGLFRAIEAAGQAVSYGLNSKVENALVTLSINFAMCLLAIPGVAIVTTTVPLYRSDSKHVAVGQREETELGAEPVVAEKELEPSGASGMVNEGR